MTILRGTKSECVRKMLALEVEHGRIFWVVSMDDFAGTYELHVSDSHAGRFDPCAITTN